MKNLASFSLYHNTKKNKFFIRKTNTSLVIAINVMVTVMMCGFYGIKLTDTINGYISPSLLCIRSIGFVFLLTVSFWFLLLQLPD